MPRDCAWYVRRGLQLLFLVCVIWAVVLHHRALAGELATAPVAIVAIVDAAAVANGLPVQLARAVVRVESRFNPRQRGRAGEYGLFQIKCATARGLGFAGACAALADARINATWGARHLALAVKRGSAGFHQAGLGARRVSRAYLAKIQRAMAAR